MSRPPFEIGPKIAAANGVAVLVHGRGGVPGGTLEQMHRLALSFGRPDVRFILPVAEGGIWYPKRFQDPRDENEPFLSKALGQYWATIENVLAQGMPMERIVLGGFSQGACLTADLLLQHPARYGAALILSGGLIGAPDTEWTPEPALGGVPVLITGSEIDEWVPASRVRETAEVLRRCGAVVTEKVYPDRPHAISPDEIVLARRMLGDVLGES